MASSEVKKVLFVSGLDFKEKSIQVIRKTPEAYHKNNWDVHYIVGRDHSRYGDYFYEPVINPSGIKIYRFKVPMAFLDGLWNHPIWKAIAFRIRNFFLTMLLALKAIRLIRKINFDVIYGYELYGVLAVRLIRWLGYGREATLIIRFQGVYAGEWERKGQRFRKILNWAYFFGLRTRADLCIMTNDGTKGDELLKKLGNSTPLLFFVNGVEPLNLEQEHLDRVKASFFAADKIHFVSVCRLVPQKRVDRSIQIVHEIVKKTGPANLLYTIIGSGAEQENLLALVKKFDLEPNVRFLGSVPNKDVKYYLECSEYFLSMDRISNVGNPLLEAIRSNKIIVTLDNGDTGSWIKHKVNGLIYPLKSIDLLPDDYNQIANDVTLLMKNDQQRVEIKNNLKLTEAKKLWTWEERLNTEVSNVRDLVDQKK